MRRLMAFLVVLLAASLAMAQDKAKPVKKAKVEPKTQRKSEPKPESKTEDAAVPEFRDPTAPTGRFPVVDTPSTRARQTVRATQLPEVKLRARILAKGKEPAAMIEVNGEILMVRKGSEITLTKASSVTTQGLARQVGGDGDKRPGTARQAVLSNLVLKVIKLDDKDVQFEVLATRQVLVVR